ncbi:MAG: hypothetical protein IPJ08_07085 [Burkholderiales bacterium]|nr:hypothetical protein [Burkholderiales bacterium]
MNLFLLRVPGTLAWMAAVTLALAACNSGGDASPPPTQGATIGPAGGTVTAAGAQVVVPAGALAQQAPIAIEATRVGAPTMPAGVPEFGAMFALTPHGTSFATPATVTLPFDPALVPAGTQPQFYKTNAAMTAFEVVAGATVSGATMVAPLSSFSFVIVGGLPPLTRHTPVRNWQFGTYLVNGTFTGYTRPQDTSGADFTDSTEFGPLLRAQPRQAQGVVVFGNFGNTYGAYAEAPSGTLRLSDEAIGSQAWVWQSQSFTKNAVDASLTFTLSAAHFVTYDENPRFGLSDSYVWSWGQMSVDAYTSTTTRPFYSAASQVSLIGEANDWMFDVKDMPYSTHPLLTREDFLDLYVVAYQPTGRCPRVEALLALRAPITYRVDLSSVGVGQEFTVWSEIKAQPLNRKGSGFALDCEGSGATTNIRDPLGMGGMTMAFSGLTPTNRPLPLPPAAIPTVAACTGPNLPEAGNIQFDSTTYTMRDTALQGTQSVRITRTGGKTGAASFRLFSQDGDAKAGTDYGAVDRTVFFADGYDTARTETINVTFRPGAQGDRFFNLFLVRTGGCAPDELGAQQAVVVIRD